MSDPPVEAETRERCASKPPQSRAASWMNADQYDAIACRCALPAGHDGDHTCGDHDAPWSSGG